MVAPLVFAGPQNRILERRRAQGMIGVGVGVVVMTVIMVVIMVVTVVMMVMPVAVAIIFQRFLDLAGTCAFPVA